MQTPNLTQPVEQENLRQSIDVLRMEVFVQPKRIPRRRKGQMRPSRPRTSRRQTAMDRADAAEADRILADPNETPIDYDSVRKELGLA